MGCAETPGPRDDVGRFISRARSTAGKLLLLAVAACGVNDTQASTALRRAVGAVNEEAPKMVDEETRFEEATADESVLTYHYTLVNHTGDMLAPSLEESLTNDLLARVCVDPQSRQLLELDLGLRYTYRSPDGEPLASILLSRGRCGL